MPCCCPTILRHVRLANALWLVCRHATSKGHSVCQLVGVSSSYHSSDQYFAQACSSISQTMVSNHPGHCPARAVGEISLSTSAILQRLQANATIAMSHTCMCDQLTLQYDMASYSDSFNYVGAPGAIRNLTRSPLCSNHPRFVYRFDAVGPPKLMLSCR